ncbi:hypothetical protein BN946_scf184959.g5 [Trametes cinnabarina]|uniref:Fungal-type protein kinase domain-containing protein n=1 Tax=Pycnoporus cinnabarinus TaxID=5643 RepID=A0A060SND2_PYCCI|nr:hypothetical protein BN946_scf184959.g5 [Trametes cinnabarina]
MCEPSSPKPSVVPEPPQPQVGSTPASRRRTAEGASLFSAHTHESRSELQMSFRKYAQTSIDDFVEKVLPPLPPGFGEPTDAVKKVFHKLRRGSNKRAKALEKQGDLYKWLSMMTLPKELSSHETVAFQPLENVIADIKAAVDACQWPDALTKPAPAFLYQNSGNTTPASLHRRDSNNSRPDVCFVHSSGQVAPAQKPSWWDIGFVGEFKKGDSSADLHNDIQKVLWSLNIIMREDPCRHFAFGFTIENTTTRLWYCDRTQIISSQAFDFSKDPFSLIWFILAALYSDETAQGWDPTIECVLENSHNRSGACQYNITVHQICGKDSVEEVLYRTESLLSQTGADGIYGRGTHV